MPVTGPALKQNRNYRPRVRSKCRQGD